MLHSKLLLLKCLVFIETITPLFAAAVHGMDHWGISLAIIKISNTYIYFRRVDKTTQILYVIFRQIKARLHRILHYRISGSSLILMLVLVHTYDTTPYTVGIY